MHNSDQLADRMRTLIERVDAGTATDEEIAAVEQYLDSVEIILDAFDESVTSNEAQ